jgi:hypothetical protein
MPTRADDPHDCGVVLFTCHCGLDCEPEAFAICESCYQAKETTAANVFEKLKRMLSDFVDATRH